MAAVTILLERSIAAETEKRKQLSEVGGTEGGSGVGHWGAVRWDTETLGGSGVGHWGLCDETWEGQCTGSSFMVWTLVMKYVLMRHAVIVQPGLELSTQPR